MAAKKTKKKATKKATKASSRKKATKKPAKKASRKKPPVALGSDERRKLLKPRESFDELIEQVVRVWGEQRGFRVPGLTMAQMGSLLRKADRAAAREQALRVKFEQRIRPLSDARLIAEDAAWRAVLDVHAAAKLYGRSRPEIAEAFGFVADALSGRATAPAPSPTPATDE